MEGRFLVRNPPRYHGRFPHVLDLGGHGYWLHALIENTRFSIRAGVLFPTSRILFLTSQNSSSGAGQSHRGVRSKHGVCFCGMVPGAGRRCWTTREVVVSGRPTRMAVPPRVSSEDEVPHPQPTRVAEPPHASTEDDLGSCVWPHATRVRNLRINKLILKFFRP